MSFYADGGHPPVLITLLVADLCVPRSAFVETLIRM